ncbi:MAG: DUF4010 domain-containing protein [Methylococcaceae bacterium]|nr:MAG: DUF4010 domain-containing protein [Methylococcaceae bacterium]
MHQLLTDNLPDLLVNFLITTAIGFLVGVGLREYYIGEHKEHVFGSTRTCVFIAIFGFVLYQLEATPLLYLGGLLAISSFLLVYYLEKTRREQYGLIGILLALSCYLLGPIAQSLPKWFLVLYAITILFVLNAKPRIQRLTEKLSNEEIITLAKFLVLTGVILPLVPSEPIAEFVPVTLHQTWLAVVVVSGMSYVGYLLQTYVLRDKGLLLTGAIGGVYSSTAITVVIARQARRYGPDSLKPAAAIVLATGIMYLRLLAVVAVFSVAIFIKLLAMFLALAGLAGLWAYRLNRCVGVAGECDANPTWEQQNNPLELASALLFAVMFVLIAGLTHWVIEHYQQGGLVALSFVVGFADIDPFVLSLVQGAFDAPDTAIAQAIIVATASNNILKAFYLVLWSNRRTVMSAGSVLCGLAGLGFLTILTGG